MNNLAERLIHNLRHDEYTRHHFHMETWFSETNSCKTVGCLAGTVIGMVYGTNKPQELIHKIPESYPQYIKPGASITFDDLVHQPYQNILDSAFYPKEASKLLGLENDKVVQHLFTPQSWIDYTSHRTMSQIIKVIPHNQRPDLSTVAAMKRFAAEYEYPTDYSPEFSDDENLPDIYDDITPSIAANALEDVLELHPSYVNWHTAFEKELA